MRSALAAFDRKGGRRRYLVADEVGLGKTVVAREIVEALSRRASGTLVVYYIANGAAVAHQNKPRVVEFLPEAQRKAAVKTPDRLSLMTVSYTPQTPVAVYALTPDTSFPRLKKASLSGGRAVERAFIGILLATAYPSVLARLPADFLRLDARSGWQPAMMAAKKRLDSIPPGLGIRYRDALRREFAADGSSAGSTSLAGRLIELAREHPRRFIGRLRRALCLACLIHQPPDIVIMDEFQRYRDLIGGETSDDPLMSQLLKGNGRKPPALLLLSATPYKLFASRWEESRGVQAHNEFFDLVDFLSGTHIRAQAQSCFKAFGDALRQLAQAPLDERQRSIENAVQLRDELQGLLLPVIGRTERSAFSATSDVLEPHVTPLATPSNVADVIAYRHLARSAAPKRRADALAYWSSVPLPAQALGQRYAISRDQTFSPMRGLTGLTRARRDRIATVDWPDAKLRALQAAAPVDSLALPWIAPSLPWWDLGGAWTRREHETKLLLFSRFKATPPAVTSLMSFGVEARWIDPRGGYEKAYARKRLKLSERPGPVMAAFHPSIWLIRNTDPLSAADRSPKGLRRQIRKQIMAALRTLGITLDRSTAEKRRRRRSIGRLLPGIEQAAGLAGRSADAWATVVSSDRQAKAAVTAWRRTPVLESVSPREVDDLVTYAIGAPGVVLGRALLRHAPDALDQDVFPSLVGVSWQGLRAYLDNPVLLSAIGGVSPIEGLLDATVSGNLESVLDEHLWTRTQSHQGGASLAADLRSALRLITGGFSFQPLGPGDRIRLRCHAAMPFGEAETAPPPKAGAPVPDVEEEAGPARPDEIRQSFNSPFWPHVLATTSVGQEGLDFHTWCARVLHWDLPSNPLDMEQREGRIQRYAGLSIRRRLGALLGADVLAPGTDGTESPWSKLASIAEERLADPAGLSPWWVLPGARVQRHVFDRPFSRDTDRYTLLREQRFIYRLCLGQPNQEDLLEILAKSDAALLATLQSLTLELCPFKQQNDREAPE